MAVPGPVQALRPASRPGRRSHRTHDCLGPTAGLNTGAAQQGMDSSPPGAIDPDGVADVVVSTWNGCMTSPTDIQTWAAIRLGLPSGGDVSVVLKDFSTLCGVAVGRFGVPTKQPPPEVPSPLTAAIDAPETVRAAQDFVYTVTLTNTTDSDFSLDPCPVYEESLTTFDGPDIVTTVKAYRLNCATMSTIAAHASVTFEMLLAVPANQPVGIGKFGWDIVGGAGLWAGATTTVTA